MRAQRLVARAGAALDQRGATMVIAARFIPGGRVAVNVSAGALGFSAPGFVVAAGAAALLWAGYHCLVGIGAQSLLDGSTVLSVALGVLCALLLGVVIEGDAYVTLEEKAAALLHSLARNHALVDGDERLALAAVIAFLGLNGRRLPLSNDEAYDLVMAVAAGELEDVPTLAERILHATEAR